MLGKIYFVEDDNDREHEVASWKNAQTAYTVKIYDKPGKLGGYEWAYGRDAWGAAELMADHFHGRLLFALNVLAWYVRDDEPQADGRFIWRREPDGSPRSPIGLYLNEFHRQVLMPYVDQKVAACESDTERLHWEKWRLTAGNYHMMKTITGTLKRLPGMTGLVAQDECSWSGSRGRRW
jgi:hypothetical protein